MSLPDPHAEWHSKANQRSRRFAEQTRKRTRRKQREQERERLLKLGAEPKWVERVLSDGDAAA